MAEAQPESGVVLKLLHNVGRTQASRRPKKVFNQVHVHPFGYKYVVSSRRCVVDPVVPELP